MHYKHTYMSYKTYNTHYYVIFIEHKSLEAYNLVFLRTQFIMFGIILKIMNYVIFKIKIIFEKNETNLN